MDLAADFSYKLSSELIMPPSFPSLIYDIDHHMEEKITKKLKDSPIKNLSKVEKLPDLETYIDEYLHFRNFEKIYTIFISLKPPHTLLITNTDTAYLIEQPSRNPEFITILLDQVYRSFNKPDVKFAYIDLIKGLSQTDKFMDLQLPKYTEFTIPKKNGKRRIIKEPHPLLKQAQRHIRAFFDYEFSSYNRTYYINLLNYERNMAYELKNKILPEIRDLMGSDYLNPSIGRGISQVPKEELTRVLRKYTFLYSDAFYNPLYANRTLPGLSYHNSRLSDKHWLYQKITNAPLVTYNQYTLTAFTGMPIAFNASYHSLSDKIYKFDLENFFPSIKYTSVKKLLIRDVLPPNMSTIKMDTLEYALTDDTSSLYIGNPATPSIANLLMTEVARYLTHKLSKHGIRFTIYADDITFSRITLGKNLVPYKNDQYFNRQHLTAVLTEALQKIEGSQLRINKKKTKCLPTKGALITGVRINDSYSLTTPRRYRRKLRAIRHRVDQHQSTTITPEAIAGMETWVNSFNKQKGKRRYVSGTNTTN